MKYFFIPGRIKNLSLAELRASLEAHLSAKYTITSNSSNYFLVETDADQKRLAEIFNRLGGFIKFGYLVDPSADIFEEYSENDAVTFGISYYQFNDVYTSDTEYKSEKLVQDLSKKIKKELLARGISARYVMPKGSALTAAQIFQRKVLEKGFELNILESNHEGTLTGLTVAVQDFEDFINRDYNRPRSDKEMGMLPPKLARMMVNLAEIPAGGTVWDPFCGSGTILMEALMLGYNVLGSDISEEAVKSTQDNILWLGEHYDLGEQRYAAFEQDITKVDKFTRRKLGLTEIDAVICEPYMGPPQRRVVFANKAEKLLSDVAALYKSLFELLENIKKHELKVVAVVPSIKTDKGWATLRYNTFMSKRWNILTQKKGNMDLQWSRSNSIISRNILIAQLKR